MTYLFRFIQRRRLMIALLAAICLTLLLPAVASAHAILISSTPAQNAVLSAPPGQVQMEFSEALDPALSTAQVVNSARQRVDQNDAHVSLADNKEMDLTLQSNLAPDVYVVVWRSVSADDGHVLLSSFTFTVARVDGSVPQLAPGNNPGQGLLGDVSSGSNGTLDAIAFFNLLMVTLVEIGAVFWVGAQIWLNFVLPTTSEKHAEEQELNKRVEERFVQHFSLPTLGVLLLANLGVLYGQALVLSGGDWLSALSPQLLTEEAISGRFGAYWLMRVVVILLAGGVGLSMLRGKRRSPALYHTLSLLNLFLGALLFIAITMSGHAASVSDLLLPYAVVIDWLHLVAAALWVGGMFTIFLIYLPMLKALVLTERTRSLLAILPQYSPLAIAGVVIMATTGPLSAAFHLTSVDQSITTAYGRALLVKILLVAALLATSSYHVFWLRPRLKKAYTKYSYVHERLQKLDVAGTGESLAATQTGRVSEAREIKAEKSSARSAQVADREVEASAPITDRETGAGTASIPPGDAGREDQPPANKLLARQVRLREERLERGTARLTRVLRWEPWLGAAILICVGLMNVFAGTLTPGNAASSPTGTNGSGGGAFHSTAKTSDGAYNVTLTISPNHFGSNVFTVQVVDTRSGKTLGANDASVSLFNTMLDMDMGTDTLDLLPDGKGGFTATADLEMGGNWRIKVQVRTPDNQPHSATFTIFTGF